MTNQQTKEQEKLESAKKREADDVQRAIDLVKQINDQKPAQDPNKIYWKG